MSTFDSFFAPARNYGGRRTLYTLHKKWQRSGKQTYHAPGILFESRQLARQAARVGAKLTAALMRKQYRERKEPKYNLDWRLVLNLRQLKAMRDAGSTVH